jgi:tripartite-type tricarboxylate transporter receptor subunit TctC
LRAIGVTGPRRSPALPDVATVAEGGVPGYEVVAWYGLFAPAGTSRAIIRRVNSEVKRILALPETRERLSAEGADVASSTPEEFSAYIKTEMTKWSKVVNMSGARAD